MRCSSFIRLSLVFIFFASTVKANTLIEKGVGSYGDPMIYEWGDGTRLIIGKYCSISADVHVLLGGNHRLNCVTTYPFPEKWQDVAGFLGRHNTSKGDVIIGNDVWIGREVMILSGIKIGDGAIVGARAVVTKNVPPYAIVAGNPAKVIRYRFNETTIKQLLEIKWWDWSETKIVKFLPLMLSPNIEDFINCALSSH